ncbi:MAG: pantoate--beta-alanine ligase [Candidatus Obscuribacterales bacterium]|nr:pantoate--beta-alanine ligase [Candidatus Obscuribacterales bacterium]
MTVKQKAAIVVESVAELRQALARARKSNSTSRTFRLGLVPTMGALHVGHEKLMEQARADCDFVVVSIFVNPLQFGPNEDFTKYPRTLADDTLACARQAVDLIFAPSVNELYGNDRGDSTRVLPPEALTARLCGLFRPGHFEAVATVVSKLFNIVQPDLSYFGQKDYQQLQVIKRLAADLDFPIEIIAVPTVREVDGLALSSRNKYLDSEKRKQAPALYESLKRVCDKVFTSGLSIEKAIGEEKASLSKDGHFQVQYLEVCCSDTLEPLSKASLPAVILVAAKLGEVRLIDNLLVP